MNVENILDMLGTIRRLEKQLIAEPDPRVREEIALTLDMLNPAYDAAVMRCLSDLKKTA